MKYIKKEEVEYIKNHGDILACRFFHPLMLWGVGYGYCLKHKTDIHCSDHCKYFKRDCRYWTKDGKCKVNEFLLYV